MRRVRSSNALAFMVTRLLPEPHFSCAEFHPDATPKKRGPKTDVLEALLKRVDGIERRLKDEKQPTSPVDEAGPSIKPEDAAPVEKGVSPPKLETAIPNEQAVFSPITPRCRFAATT